MTGPLGHPPAIEATRHVADAGSPGRERIRAGRLTSTPFLDIHAEPVTWLLAGRVALSSLTIVCGPAGLGKTLLALRLCADCSRGVLEGDLEDRPAAALVVAGEDPASSVLRPRLDAAGADLGLVYHVGSAEGRVAFPGDVPAVVEFVVATGARLVIIDPITSVLQPDASPNSEHDVRMSLEPLIAAAAEHNFAVLGIQHRNKTKDLTGLDRLLGSTAWGALARTVFEVQLVAENPIGQGRLLVALKANLGPRPADLAFSIEPTFVVGDDGGLIPTARVVLQSETEPGTAGRAAPSLCWTDRLILTVVTAESFETRMNLRRIGDRLAELGHPLRSPTILLGLGRLGLAGLIDEAQDGWWRTNGHPPGVPV